MFALHGLRAVVTGAGQGIGRAIAQALATQGATVAVLDRDAALAQATAAELGGAAVALTADIADCAETIAVLGGLLTKWGRLDILVNNAAIVSTLPFAQITEAEWDRVLAVNLKGAYSTCQAVLPHMALRGSGRVINIASVAGKRGGGLLGSARPTRLPKPVVIGLTKALAREFAANGVTVNAVCPGPVQTTMTDQLTPESRARALSQVPLGRFAHPAEIAAAVVYLASAEAAFVTGEIMDVDGGLLMD